MTEERLVLADFGAAQAARWSANKLSGRSASSDVNRGSKRNRVPQ
jgi:hypothetical protein